MTAHDYPASPRPLLAFDLDRWRVRVHDPGVLADLERLTATADGRAAGVLLALHSLAEQARAWLRGESPTWVELEAGALAVTDGPDYLGAGTVDPGDPGDDSAEVAISPAPTDRAALAVLEVALAHVNGARLSLAAMVRLIIVRGADLDRRVGIGEVSRGSSRQVWYVV